MQEIQVLQLETINRQTHDIFYLLSFYKHYLLWCIFVVGTTTTPKHLCSLNKVAVGQRVGH